MYHYCIHVDWKLEMLDDAIKPEDAITARTLEGYSPEKTKMLKRGYFVEEVDNFFSEVRALLSMYEGGSNMSALVGDMITAEDVNNKVFSRNANGYNMKEIDRVMERIALALTYYERQEASEFGINKRRKKERNVNVSSDVIDAELDESEISPPPPAPETLTEDTSSEEDMGLFGSPDTPNEEEDVGIFGPADDSAPQDTGQSFDDIITPPSSTHSVEGFEEAEEATSLVDSVDDVSHDSEENIAEPEPIRPSFREVGNYDYSVYNTIPNWREYV